MKRREFIGIAAAGAAGFVLPVTVARAEAFSEPLAHPRLLEILRDEQIVRHLGARYRERVPAERSEPALRAALARDLPAASPLALGDCADEQVQRDFAQGRTVTLNGWILSVTEARQCALYSLLSA